MLELHAGHYYVTAKPQIVGPLSPSQTHNVWRWAWQGPDGWMHWTAEGKYRTLGESSHDIVREASEAEVAAAKEGRVLASTLEAQTAQSQATPVAPMTKHRLLDLAKAATADRGLNYGKPEDNFARIARRWNTFLVNKGYIPDAQRFTDYGGPINPADVAMMCADLKMARLENQPVHQDSWVDLAGYAACGAEIALAATPQHDENSEGRV